MNKNEDKSFLSQIAKLDLALDEIVTEQKLVVETVKNPTVVNLMAAKISKIAEKFAELQQQTTRLQNEKLLLLANVENLKKQWYEEKTHLQKYQSKFLGSEMLAFLDNFELALSYQNPSIEVQQFLKGFTMMHQMVLNALNAEGIKVMDTKVGDPFDHNLHDAIEQVKDETIQPRHIIKIMKKGYYLHDHVLRHASVIVSE